MPTKTGKVIAKLTEIIQLCTYWRESIIGKTKEGLEILEEFKEEEIIEVLSDYV